MKLSHKIEWAIFIASVVLLFAACSSLVAVAYFETQDSGLSHSQSK